MRIRMLSDRTNGSQWFWAGEVYDYPDSEAKRLIAAHQAELVEGPECAMVGSGTEKMVQDRPRTRIGGFKHVR